MQRLRLTPNIHVGLALGIATASVILALGGCAITPTTSGATQSADSAPPTASLDQFSEDEQARILAVQEIVAKAAAEHQLDPALLNGMIWVESRFDPKAKSPAGARGLMQLMPSTAVYLAKRMGEQSARAYDPEFNVRAGALYLAEMQQKFGDEQLAVAAYHAGPGNVKKWVESGQKFPEYSDAYVAKVMAARARFTGVDMHGRHSGQRTKPAPVAKPEPRSVPVAVEIDPVDELVAPDVSTLPDAAEIHGIDRVIYERPEPEPEPDHEPVFEVHRELDRQPNKPPPGWNLPTRATEPKPTPRPRPRPAPAPAPEQPVGLGVLPDL